VGEAVSGNGGRAPDNFTRTEIPRHKTWDGPLVLPVEHKAVPGNRTCSKCGRQWKGRCPCLYYKRTTTFIDVIQNEFALKQWDRRLVAYGMGQRPDLVLAAVACYPPSDPFKAQPTREQKDKLQAIADEAKQFAMSGAAATVGTSLHTLTQWMDEGQTLGYVPEPYPADLRAYEDMKRDNQIEYLEIESFRVHDEYQVGGTTDRMGYVRSRSGRYRVLDVKTGSIWWEGGPAMQLSMYARSVKYDIAMDARVSDADDVDLDVGYVIHLPQGKGVCELIPVDIQKGWRACEVAKQVWDMRGEKNFFFDEHPREYASFAEMAARAGSVKECQMLWRNAREQGKLTQQVKDELTNRVEFLKSQAQQRDTVA